MCATNAIQPGRAPLRRLTRFEYGQSVGDLLGESPQVAQALPAEQINEHAIFVNNADQQSTSPTLVEKYSSLAEDIAKRATATPAALAKLASCTTSMTAATQAACARDLADRLASRAFRRALTPTELDDLLALHNNVAPTAGFAVGVATVIEAVLQAPDFLYRPEWGVVDPAHPEARRLTGYEMATRLSYLFWATSPDDSLLAAARAGQLQTAEGVKAMAVRLLDDPRSRQVIRSFFDALLPLPLLSSLERDRVQFPAFSASLGAAMREETQRLLEYEIFQAGGSWRSILTAPYTFVNGPLARFYGIGGVEGEAFQKVDVDRTKRRGLLTHAGVMAGTVTTNRSNPVLRGSFISNKIMCRGISLPADPALLAKIKVPDETTARTARQRFSQHSEDPVCASCHSFLDPLGFALETFDPIGQYRTQDNGLTIDANVTVPGIDGAVNGPLDLVTKIAALEETHACFASHWLDFAYGHSVTGCAKESIEAAFKRSGYNVRQLLIDLTQTDAFLYLSAAKE